MVSQYNIGKHIGSSADYNANNSWYFNGNNGSFNNNNRYNRNFRCRPVLDYDCYNNANIDTYPISLEYLLIMSQLTAKGKHSKPSCVFFHLHRANSLVSLCHEVNLCEYMPREGTAHVIFEPKVREIVCSSFASRVMQTYYITSMRSMLDDFYHPDSYSCRRGKGGLKAIQRLQEYIYDASEGYAQDVWLAKVDIKAFFMSIDCVQVCEIFTRLIVDRMAGHPQKDILLYLTRVIYLAATKDNIKDMARPRERALLDLCKSIFNQPYYHGVPIGDWASQTAGLVVTTFALNYLTSLGYTFIHYTDDTIVVVRDKEKWMEDVDRLARYYKDILGLTLHPHKRYLQHYSKGVEALGYKVRFNRILPSDRIYHNLMWYMERTIRKSSASSMYAVRNKDKILSTINSYLGFLKWCNGYNLRKKVCGMISDSSIGMVIYPSSDYSKVAIRKKYSTKHYYHTNYKLTKQKLITELT